MMLEKMFKQARCNGCPQIRIAMSTPLRDEFPHGLRCTLIELTDLDDRLPARVSPSLARGAPWQDPLGGGNSARMTLRLQQLFELLDRQAGILDDAAHSECVDGIVAGNRDDPLTIRHHDVLSLAGDTKACLLQCANGIAMIDAWNSRHVNRRLRPPAPRLPS